MTPQLAFHTRMMNLGEERAARYPEDDPRRAPWEEIAIIEDEFCHAIRTDEARGTQ